MPLRTMKALTRMKQRKSSVGERVEVRSKEEILRTLDSNGQLDGMPFMPEMFEFCGKKFEVYKRAHKTCDTINPARGRRVDRAVHLNTRCDGAAHGGCQAGCLIFWKEAWLKPIGSSSGNGASGIDGSNHGARATSGAGCTELDVRAKSQAPDPKDGTPTYVCQATRLPYATSHLAWWDVRQYVEDFWSGNVGLWRMFSGLVYSIYCHISQSGIGVGPVMEWLYDKCNPLWHGTPFPRAAGTIPEGQPTPKATLNLQPGELVRVKPLEEILRTLNKERKNRGMAWDAELVPYCGGTFGVLKRVTKILD